MSLTRIYVPLTPSMVRALQETREIAPAPIPAHAVTRRLERARASRTGEGRPSCMVGPPAGCRGWKAGPRSQSGAQESQARDAERGRGAAVGIRFR